MFHITVISNHEKTLFGVDIFESDNGRWCHHIGVEVKYSKEDAEKMAKEIEDKLKG